MTSPTQMGPEPVALQPGDVMPPMRVGPITRTDIVRYAGAGGDMNPIHHDEEYARAIGLPSVFAMGLLPGGALGMRLSRWVGPNNVRSFVIRFTGQVWPGDVLLLNGRVERVERGTESIAHLMIGVDRADGTPVIQGSATAIVA